MDEPLGWLDETELETIPRQNITTGDVISLPEGEGVSQTLREVHPTADEITTLVDTSKAANVSLEACGHDMRRLMQLPESQKITKKFLRETMTMDQYNTARAHYGKVLRLVLEEDVPNHEPPSETRNASTAQVVPEASVEVPPTGKEPPAVPSVSSSAPSPDADAEQAREKLRREALSWYIQPIEIEHMLAHHDLVKARNILWKAHRNMPKPVWVEAAD
jgi:hypothetical protein